MALAEPVVDVRAGRAATVRTANGTASFRITTKHVCRADAELDFEGNVSGTIEGDRIDLYTMTDASVRYVVHCNGKRVSTGKLAVISRPVKDARDMRVDSYEERVGGIGGDNDAKAPPPGPPGYLRIKTKPTAAVHVDGVDTKLTTPIEGKTLELAPGRHVITFVAAQYRFKRSVMIKPGTIERMFVALPTN